MTLLTFSLSIHKNIFSTNFVLCEEGGDEASRLKITAHPLLARSM